MGKHHPLRIVLVAVLVVALTLSGVLLSSAVWDETTAVHVDPAAMEPSTLVVGTHLIHLSALTDSIYTVAKRSAEDSGQLNLYYRSELAGGAWFDITSATTLADITTAGSPVGEEVIAALFFTHHTKSDGVTYDLRTGLAVDPRDIYTPYDLEALEELFPLKLQYDLLRETQSDSKVGRAKIARVAEFFSTSVITDLTIRSDTELAALQVYYDVLNAGGAGADEKNAVQSVMDAVDAGRRATVYGIVEEALATYLEELSVVKDTADEEGTVSEGAMPDTNLQSAVSDSLNNIRAAKTSCEGRMLAPGVTVGTSVRYTFSRALTDHAAAQNHAACDEDVKNLLNLEHILAGVFSDRAAELALLDEVLIPQATAVYTGGLTAGVSGDYSAALAQNAADVLLRSIARENGSLLNSYRNELEFFLTAKLQRQSTAEGGTYLDGRLALAQGYYALVPDDPFREGAAATVDSHIEYLTRQRRTLELSAGGNEIDALITQKSDLQREMMACLDDNDLTGAKALEDKIAEVDAKLQGLAGESLSALADLNRQQEQLVGQLEEARAAGDETAAAELEGRLGSLKGQIANLNAGMAEGTLGARVAGLKSDVLAGIEAGDGAAALAGIEALAGLLSQDYGVVFPALKDLYTAMSRARELDGSKVFDQALNAVETAILNHADGYRAALRTDLTADDLERLSQAFFAARTGGGGGLFDTGAGTETRPTAGEETQRPAETPGSGAGASVCDLLTPADGGQGGGGRVGGGSLSAFSGDPAIQLAALEMYYVETGSAEAAALLATLSQQELNLGNPLIFARVDDAGREYLPLTALRAYTGMRYVWNRNLSLGTLARGADYYGFTAYSDQVRRSQSDADAETMTLPTQFQGGVVHVCEAYTAQAFEVEAIYLSGTNRGVLCDPVLLEQALLLFATYLSAG